MPMISRPGRLGWIRAKTPPALPGQCIGVLGGTFNPAHGGHVQISNIALARLRLVLFLEAAAPLVAVSAVSAFLGTIVVQVLLRAQSKVAVPPPDLMGMALLGLAVVGALGVVASALRRCVVVLPVAVTHAFERSEHLESGRGLTEDPDTEEDQHHTDGHESDHHRIHEARRAGVADADQRDGRQRCESET